MSVIALAAVGGLGLAVYDQRRPKIQVQKCASKKCPPRAFPMMPLGKKDLSMYVNEIPEAVTIRYDLPSYNPKKNLKMEKQWGGYLGKGGETGGWSYVNQSPLKTLPEVYTHHQSLLEKNATTDPGVQLVYGYIA